MDKTILTILFFCFLFFSATAQVENKRATEKEKMEKQGAATAYQANQQPVNLNAPVITFDKTVHDYGTLVYDADGNCQFKLTNEGKEPLVITSVKASWGCTAPTWPRQPVLPGKSEVIVVRYNTKKVGKINKTIRVYSNASETPVYLKVTGQVIKEPATSIPENGSTGAPVKK